MVKLLELADMTQKALLGRATQDLKFFKLYLYDKEKFFSIENKKIFQAIKKQADTRDTLDIAEFAVDTNMSFKDAVEFQFLYTQSSVEAQLALERLKKIYVKYRVFSILDELKKDFERGNVDIDSDAIQKILNELQDLQAGKWMKATEVEQTIKNEKFFFSKFREAKDLFFAYRSGDLHVIAARPGVGKTTFLLNEAESLAKQGHKVGFVTLEMPAYQCVNRVIANVCNVTMHELRAQGGVHAVIAKNADKTSHINNIMFFEDYSVDINTLVASIRRAVAAGVDVIFIDQISHIRHTDKAYSKADAVERTVRTLRSLALELNICIIAANQISRAALQTEEPQLEHLKESGALEEASQLVLMLQQKENELVVYVRKATHGRLGKFSVIALYERAQFVSAPTIDF